jgi:ATP-binding cassette subfamily F protein uup
MAPLLHLKDITVAFGGKKLLDGAELSVGAGDRLCLVGRNGSGKSTLLKIAAGLMEADSGTRFAQPGATIRYLPQEPDLSGYASTRDYVEAGLNPHEDPNRACRAWKTPQSCRAARPGGRPWRGRSRPGPTSCCWTSRPIIWM